MDIISIIDKKRNNLELTKEEIDFFVTNFTKGKIPNYQASALLMAICINGMTKNETYYLTYSMQNSGQTLNLNKTLGVFVDKHSTGGVSDSTTIPLMSIISCAGLKSIKMSGAGLGFTGGTFDKLKVFPNIDLQYDIGIDDERIEKYGIMYCTQAKNIAPADKKIYALRDVTGTVQSIPLIASSIMSKKLACNSDVIFLDIKCGNGAFMHKISEAKKLAKTMIDIGKSAGKTMGAVISDMNQPLGNGIGCALEVLDGINVLKGKKSPLATLTKILAINMLVLSKKYTETQATSFVNKVISSGEAYTRFKQIITAQGGDISIIDLLEKEYKPDFIVCAPSSGYLKSYDTSGLGYLVRDMGGGRLQENEEIDHYCGIKLRKKIGDTVKQSEALFEVYLGNKLTKEEVVERLNSLYEIVNSKKPPTPPVLVYDYIK